MKFQLLLFSILITFSVLIVAEPICQDEEGNVIPCKIVIDRIEDFGFDKLRKEDIDAPNDKPKMTIAKTSIKKKRSVNNPWGWNPWGWNPWGWNPWFKPPKNQNDNQNTSTTSNVETENKTLPPVLSDNLEETSTIVETIPSNIEDTIESTTIAPISQSFTINEASVNSSSSIKTKASKIVPKRTYSSKAPPPRRITTTTITTTIFESSTTNEASVETSSTTLTINKTYSSWTLSRNSMYATKAPPTRRTTTTSSKTLPIIKTYPSKTLPISKTYPSKTLPKRTTTITFNRPVKTLPGITTSSFSRTGYPPKITKRVTTYRRATITFTFTKDPPIPNVTRRPEPTTTSTTRSPIPIYTPITFPVKDDFVLTGFHKCTSDETEKLNNLIPDLQTYKGAALEVASHPDNLEYNDIYKKYFKEEKVRDTVLFILNSINDMKSVEAYCDAAEDPVCDEEATAWTYTNSTEIHLCPKFFKKAMDGSIQKHTSEASSIILHELTHLFGTNDYGYGEISCVLINYADAAWNADNYRLFAMQSIYYILDKNSTIKKFRSSSSIDFRDEPLKDKVLPRPPN